MRFVTELTSSPFGSDEQRERILDMVIAGTVNGGGPLLKLRSSGGNIDISTM